MIYLSRMGSSTRLFLLSFSMEYSYDERSLKISIFIIYIYIYITKQVLFFIGFIIFCQPKLLRSCNFKSHNFYFFIFFNMSERIF